VSPQSSIAVQVRKAAQARDVAQLIRELQTNRSALGSYLAGTARPGTVLLIETRFRELVQRESASQSANP
jgi:hypothetical protein